MVHHKNSVTCHFHHIPWASRILHNMEFQGESLLEIFTAPMLGYFRGIL